MLTSALDHLAELAPVAVDKVDGRHIEELNQKVVTKTSSLAATLREVTRRLSEESMRAERLQFQSQVASSIVLTLVFSGLCWHFSSTGLSPRKLPSPSDFGAVLVEESSPRNQASVWVSTPKNVNVAVDPSQDVELQFYASFETTGANTNPPDMSSDDMLKKHNVSYVLVDRLARHVKTCNGASVSDFLEMDDLSQIQQQMAAQALGIAGHSEAGPNPPTASPSQPVDRAFKVLNPSSAKADGWASPAGWQPTSVTDFTCRFAAEGFWLEGGGAWVFTLPALYGDLRGNEPRSSAQQRLVRRAVLARPAPESPLRFSDGEMISSLDSNQNLIYETSDEVGGASMTRASTRIWYGDQQFENNKAQEMFLAGIFASFGTTTLLELFSLLREWFVDRRTLGRKAKQLAESGPLNR